MLQYQDIGNFRFSPDGDVRKRQRFSTAGRERMASNFDFLDKHDNFREIAVIAKQVEKVIPISPVSGAVTIRTIAELSVKWIFKVDNHLRYVRMPRTFDECLSVREFQTAVGSPLLRKIDEIRVQGNKAAHEAKATEHSCLSLLRTLHEFLAWITQTYLEEIRIYIPPFNSEIVIPHSAEVHPGESLSILIFNLNRSERPSPDIMSDEQLNDLFSAFDNRTISEKERATFNTRAERHRGW